MVELEMHHVPSPTLVRNYATTLETENCIEALTKALNHSIKTVGKIDRETGRSAPWWNEGCATAY